MHQLHYCGRIRKQLKRKCSTGATGALHIQIKGGTTTRLGGFGNQLAGPYKYQPGHPVPLIVGEYQAGPNVIGAVHRFLLSPTTSSANEWSLYE